MKFQVKIIIAAITIQALGAFAQAQVSLNRVGAPDMSSGCTRKCHSTKEFRSIQRIEVKETTETINYSPDDQQVRTYLLIKFFDAKNNLVNFTREAKANDGVHKVLKLSGLLRLGGSREIRIYFKEDGSVTLDQVTKSSGILDFVPTVEGSYALTFR